MFRSHFILLSVLILPFFIFADAESDFDVVKCYESALSNSNLQTCASQDFEFSDKKLNQIYTSVLDQIKSTIDAETTIETDTSTEVLNRLINAEKAWLAYRDAQCQFEGTAMLGDPSEDIVVTGCLSRLTKDRIKMLAESLPKDDSEENP